MFFTLIKDGSVYTPTGIQKLSLLLMGEKIVKVGDVDFRALERAGLEAEIIDAAGCWVLPGLIDPHSHLIGAGGENGFASRLPEIPLEDMFQSGITTVVGLLGTDTVSRDPKCLYAKVQQLNREGMTAYMYTNGFELPGRTIMDSVIDDLVMIDPVIGTGEIAISDPRWLDPKPFDLAHIISQTKLGGQMAGKAGITHFHVGPTAGRLDLLNTILDDYEIDPEYIYATHVTRTPELLKDAVQLVARGAYVDMDTVEENIAESMWAYLKQGGDPARLTVSSDAHTPGGTPQKFFSEFISCLQDDHLSMEQVLPCFTSNTADVLKLQHKGRLQPNADADVLILSEKTYEMNHLFAQGRHVVKDGRLIGTSEQEKLLQEGKP